MKIHTFGTIEEANEFLRKVRDIDVFEIKFMAMRDRILNVFVIMK